MKQRVVRKDDIGSLLRQAQKTRRVFAPVHAGDEVALTELSGTQEPVLAFTNFKQSPKRLFLPQCEALCTFADDRLEAIPLPEDKVVVFGIRPCDAAALACLDKIFGEFGKTGDPYYLRRRENSVVVALACMEPCETCFCTSVGGSPVGVEGADAVAFDLGDRILIETQTEKGAAFLDDLEADCSRHSGGAPTGKHPASDSVAGARPPSDELPGRHPIGLAEPQAADIAARDMASQKAIEKIRKMDLTGLKEILEKSFDSPVWASVSEICLGCGLCTYQCPTCHCFDISDEKKGDKGRRIRTWDSCQFSMFTLHASGHNPRPSKKERMRQRILHKFQYTVDNVDRVFCVGCGRCVANCPVNLDIRETLVTLKKWRN